MSTKQKYKTAAVSAFVLTVVALMVLGQAGGPGSYLCGLVAWVGGLVVATAICEWPEDEQ